jgi:acetyl-CoA/propionyl-CoA carboxylase biotin carboxyl carrier protein
LALPSLLLSGLGAAGQSVASVGGAGGKPAEDGIAAPVSGTLQAFKIVDGATVTEGELVAVMEAMKMETQVLAPKAGRLRLRVKEGDYLQAGDTLMVFEG